MEIFGQKSKFLVRIQICRENRIFLDKNPNFSKNANLY